MSENQRSPLLFKKTAAVGSFFVAVGKAAPIKTSMTVFPTNLVFPRIEIGHFSSEVHAQPILSGGYCGTALRRNRFCANIFRKGRLREKPGS